MCGRFAQADFPPALRRKLHRTVEELKLEARFNVAPTENALVVLQEAGRPPRTAALRWGLGRNSGPGLFNARSETAGSKPSFREAFERRRCLVPVTGFYEWRKNGARRIPWYFTGRDEDHPVVLAGLWEGGAFTILTTEANRLMRPIHDRMPVLLAPGDWTAWLDPATPGRELPERLFVPFEADFLRCWEVSDYVNDAANQGPRCLEPAATLGF